MHKMYAYGVDNVSVRMIQLENRNTDLDYNFIDVMPLVFTLKSWILNSYNL